MLDFRKMLDEILESDNTEVYVDEYLQFASVTHKLYDDEYVFQGDDYDLLYTDYENSGLSDEFDFEDYLYIVSQSW